MSGAAPSGPGRALAVGVPIVATILGGTYYSMLRSKKKQEKSGTNPYWEQVVKGVSAETPPGLDLPPRWDKESVSPPAFVRHDHYNGHKTIQQLKKSPEYEQYGEDLRRMVPPPQRGRRGDEGRAYTKSPDYVNNYNKTKRRADKHEEAPSGKAPTSPADNLVINV